MIQKLFLWCFFLVSMTFVNAQSITVTGTITDQNNMPLPGVNVLEKNTSNGVATDFDGNYSITVSSNNAIIIFSSLGFSSQETEVGNQTTIDIVMEEDAAALDEVIVVGYGTVKKKDLTGAITQVDVAAIANNSPNSVTDLLRANVAGLAIGNSSSPKGVSNFEIRGDNSLTASSSPLIILDGMIYNGDLSDINPSDIDKIDVMKDASSAAIYGARGASGVILIRTKKGVTNKPTVNISTSVGMVQEASPEKPYSADGYVNWRSDVFKSINVGHEAFPGRYDDPNNLPAGVTLDQWLAYDGSQGDPTRAWLNRLGFQDVEIENYLEGKSIDWYDRIRQTGFRNSLDLSVSGRNKGVNYYWSIGRTENEGITVGDKFETLRSRINLDAKITDFLTVGMNTQFARRDESAIPADEVQIQRSSPWGSFYDDDGNIRRSPQDDSGAGATNAFIGQMFTDRNDIYKTFNSRMYAKVKLPYNISYELGLTNRLENRRYLNHNYAESPSRQVGDSRRYHTEVNEWLVENIVKWSQTFGKHNVAATFVATAEEFQSYATDARANTFEPSDALGYHNLGSGTIQTTSSDDSKSTGDALVGRLNYSFDSRYLLTLTVRRDGFSGFGPNTKRATFPSIATGWTISEEDFFDSKLINNLKLRVSYGETGNIGVGRYAYLSTLSSGKNLNASASNGNVFTVSTLDNTTQENSGLQWESTAALNFGVDFSLLGGKIDGTLDIYKNTTDNLLVTRLLPNIIGFSSVLTNLGEVTNSGMEFAVRTQNIAKKDFSWNTSFNFNFNRNKITKLYGDLDENGNELDDITNRRFIGQAQDVIWGKEVVGVYQLGDEAEAAAFGVFPGDFKILDADGDGAYTVEDNTFQGHFKPRFNWAMTNSFTFLKNFDLAIEIYSSLGQSRAFNNAKNRNGFIDRTNSFQTPYWTPENPTNDYARLFSSDGNAGFNVYRNSSFVRLNNITLGYNLPQELANKFLLNSLKIYANIRNVAVWAPDWDLGDPESSSISGTSGVAPAPRFFTLGINLSL